MKVYFDIDGVWADFDAVMRKTIRETLPGKVFRDEVARHWDLDQAYLISKEDVATAWTSERFLENLADAPVVEIGPRLLHAFRDEEVCFITSRSTGKIDSALAQQIRTITVDWLQKSIRERNNRPVPNIEFDNDKVGCVARNGCSVAVEDAPHHVELMLEQGLTVFMPVWPYNEHLVGLEGLVPVIRT